MGGEPILIVIVMIFLTAKVNGACRHGGMATKRGRRDSQGECCLTRMPSLVGNELQPGVRKPVLQKLKNEAYLFVLEQVLVM